MVSCPVPLTSPPHCYFQSLHASPASGLELRQELQLEVNSYDAFIEAVAEEAFCEAFLKAAEYLTNIACLLEESSCGERVEDRCRLLVEEWEARIVLQLTFGDKK